MENLSDFIPYLIPILILQILLIIIAMLDLIHREKTRGPKWIWVLVILFINLIGPILYLLLGREES